MKRHKAFEFTKGTPVLVQDVHSNLPEVCDGVLGIATGEIIHGRLGVEHWIDNGTLRGVRFYLLEHIFPVPTRQDEIT